MQELIAYYVAFMLSFVPAGVFDAPAYERSKARESRSEQTERFNAIARATAEVVLDPAERPLAYFRGPRARIATGIMLLAVAKYEGGYRRDVDTGVGPLARGDYGQSWCLMQIKVGAGRTAQGSTGEDLVGDRRKCMRAGLHAIQRSWGCGSNVFDALTPYVGGRCATAATEHLYKDGSAWRQKSRARVSAALRWINSTITSFTDESLLRPPAPESQNVLGFAVADD